MLKILQCLCGRNFCITEKIFCMGHFLAYINHILGGGLNFIKIFSGRDKLMCSAQNTSTIQNKIIKTVGRFPRFAAGTQRFFFYILLMYVLGYVKQMLTMPLMNNTPAAGS